MAKYLYMDGVDDWLRAPSFTFDKMTLDCQILHKPAGTAYMYFDFRPTTHILYFRRNVNGTDEIQGATRLRITIDDITIVGGSIAVPNDRCAMKVSMTDFEREVSTGLFCSSSNGSLSEGFIYDVKFYRGESLVAHYDMSTGTVQDQSGNGNHATLHGGTWVQDEPDDPTGEDVAYNFETTQSIFANISTEYETKQSIFSNESIQYATTQTIHANRSFDYATRQTIFSDYVLFTEDYPMQMKITQEQSTNFGIRLQMFEERTSEYKTLQAMTELITLFASMKQIVYNDNPTYFGTAQVIHTNRMYDYPVVITMYDPDKAIMSRVSLKGSRELRVNLEGSREIRVKLEASREIKVRLRGDV